MSAAKHTPGTDSFGRPLPTESIPVSVLMPPPDRPVVLYVEDANVAIHGTPVVGWNSGTKQKPTWWAGLPGNYMLLVEHRWTVTHWAALPGDEECRAAISKVKGGAL